MRSAEQRKCSGRTSRAHLRGGAYRAIDAPHRARGARRWGFRHLYANDFTDAYVKLVFVRHDIDVGELSRPLTLDSFDELPPEQRPTVRTYTVRRVDTESANSPSTSSCTANTVSPVRGQRPRRRHSRRI